VGEGRFPLLRQRDRGAVRVGSRTRALHPAPPHISRQDPGPQRQATTMKTPQPHPEADQTHSAAPSISKPRQAQQASPDADAIAHSPRMTAQRQAIRATFGPAAASAVNGCQEALFSGCEGAVLECGP